jgi:hypothetical protein
MKKILALTLLVMFLVGNVLAQPTPPATPPSPESQGIQIPQASSSSQAPPSSESSQTLTPTSAASAQAAAPSTLATAPSYGTGAPSYQGTASSYATSAPSTLATAPSYVTGAPSYQATTGSSAYASTYMVVPPGVTTPNKFYVPYSPSTVAGCNFGQWLPMWLDVSGTGPLYMYEWYPNGKLVSKYMASIRYPGWQKMWFNGDAAGWHTLQYYCNGWSNYIYVYVYAPYYPPYYDSGSYPQPTYPAYPQTPEPGCNAQIVITSEYMRGYSVSVDGTYIGGDGRRGDHFDGNFAFTVTGGQPHTITVDNDGSKYTQTNTYSCGQTYTMHI